MSIINNLKFKTLEIKHFTIAIFILFSFISGCNNNSLSKRKYNKILDSLRQIQVPLVLDTAEFFKRERIDRNIHLPDSNGFIIFESHNFSSAFHREVRHKDSLFGEVFDYNSNGLLKRYYRKYMNSCNDFPIGYVIYYNEQGEVEPFCDSNLITTRAGDNVPYTIYDVINELKQDGVDLLKHNVYICLTNWIDRKEGEQLSNKYYWLVVINYYHDYDAEYKEIKYQHKLRISPDTGEVLEDRIEEWNQ